MKIEEIAELILSQYNSDKKLHGKGDFKKIVSLHFRSFGHLIKMSYAEFFKKMSAECQKVQPTNKKLGGRLVQKIGDQKYLLENAAMERVRREKIELGNGDIELGEELYELYQHG